MESRGWVKLHRRMLDNAITTKPNYAWLWCVILMMANHKKKEFIWNGKKQVCNPGQILTGRKALSLKSGISPGTVENILKYLESEQQIEQQKTNRFRLITVVKWNDYQGSEQQIEQQNDNRMTTDEQQNDTNKNDNNNNNDKNDKKLESSKISKEIIALTPKQECELFFSENEELKEKIIDWLISTGTEYNKAKIEIEKFINFWIERTSNGKKQKWQIQKTFEVKRRLRTWISNSEKWSNNKSKATEEDLPDIGVVYEE